MEKTAHFSRDDAKCFYDRFGKSQDRQGFYEDAALDALVQHGDFSAAQSVFELGCGTGRLAARLLAEHLPSSARYVATDISETMIHLTKERLEPWAARSAVYLNSGKLDLSSCGGPFDRFVCTYVFDLFSMEEIAETLTAARSSVKKGGLLCTAGLTYGTDVLSSTTSKLWSLVCRINPSLVGGCRPLALSDFILQTQWRILHREVVVKFAVPSEVLVVEAI
jgi:ubiquinone/menaquinone biosynthesis C-methylase UbiE